MKLYQEFLIGQDSEVVKEINVAGAVITKTMEDETKSILLIQRDKNDHWPLIWEFPRGKANPGENNIKKILKREVKEETGLDIEIIKYIDKYEYLADQGTRKSTQYNYLCTVKNPDQKIKLSKEHQDYKWVSSMGEIELFVPSEMKKTILKVLNRDYQIVNYPKTDEVIEETQNKWYKLNDKINHK
jgi:8-oxo-dGTP pyrophosphatase MutT (NUDIX family)